MNEEIYVYQFSVPILVLHDRKYFAQKEHFWYLQIFLDFMIGWSFYCYLVDSGKRYYQTLYSVQQYFPQQRIIQPKTFMFLRENFVFYLEVKGIFSLWVGTKYAVDWRDTSKESVKYICHQTVEILSTTFILYLTN